MAERRGSGTMSVRHHIQAVLVGLVVVTTACVMSPRPTVPSGGTLGPCPLFPADGIFSARVDRLPVHPRSDAWRTAIGSGAAVHPDFGSGLWEGSPIGIPYATVGAEQARVPMHFDYADESDPGPYPIPPGVPVEGGSDHHVIVVDTDACRLYETFDSALQPDGSWRAGSGAAWNLRSNALRPTGWTSADAAGLPILPTLVRYDEIAAGRVDHMIRFTAPRTQRSSIWPARHSASSITDPDVPPMGAVFRLRAGVDISYMAPQARVVAQAMKEHGIILADNGSPWFISGVPDDRWDNDALRDLKSLNGRDFEAVDTSSLMVEPNSGQVR